MNPLIREVVTTVGLEKPARHIYRTLRAKGLTPWAPLVPEEAFSACVRQAVETLQELDPPEALGDYLEFGVSRGSSMACTYRILRSAGLRHMRLIGFDSFEGLPPEAEREGWAAGDFHSSYEATRRYLKRRRVDLDRVMLVKGWFKDTLTEKTRQDFQIGTASLIMVDCDIYSASKDVLNFCEPHIRRQAVVMFDDWGDREEKDEIGQKEAFAEFLADHPDLAAEPMPAYSPQARVFLVRRLPEGTERHSLKRAFESVPDPISLPKPAPGRAPTYHRVSDRNSYPHRLRQLLLQRNVVTAVSVAALAGMIAIGLYTQEALVELLGEYWGRNNKFGDLTTN